MACIFSWGFCRVCIGAIESYIGYVGGYVGFIEGYILDPKPLNL